MKKGFTLIELLAVIVILAVIALISVPMILGIIEDSKKGAFKDSVSLTFSAAELYETKDSIPTSGVELKDLSLKNNNFKYGKIIKNANNELEVINVSDGNYCANGILTNLIIYKGECDTTIPSAPSASVESSIYGTTKEYTLTVPETLSGIDSYEYYLSDSNITPETNVTVSGTSKSNIITINKVSKYIFFRAVSKVGLIGAWSSAKTNYVDLTLANVSLSSNIVTNKSVVLNAVCSDPESGIIKYEFSKDGTNYIDNGTNSSYTFNNVLSGTNTYFVKCTNGALEKTIASTQATMIYNTYSNGTAIYFNPVSGAKCTAAEAVSTPGTKTGCMKWYAFNDKGNTTDKIDLLLDHNTTAYIPWNSTGSNVNGPTNLIAQLQSDTSSWLGVPVRSDTYSVSNGTASYTINYNNYRARLISAKEVANITNNTSFSEATTPYTSWFYLDNNSQTQVSKSIGASNYEWLYDYTKDCTSFGCNVASATTNGYWTSTAIYGISTEAWFVYRESRFYYNSVQYASDYGVRPVVTLFKFDL